MVLPTGQAKAGPERRGLTQCRIQVTMPSRDDNARHRSGRTGRDLAAEAERARTPRTPFVALAGVWIAVANVVALLLALALTLYYR